MPDPTPAKVEPGPAAVPPPAVPAPAPAPAAPAAASAAATPPEPTPPAPPTPVEPTPAPAAPKADWRDSRIAELTAKLHDERKKAVATAEPPRAGESQAEFDSRVNARAAELAAQADWQRQCVAVIDAGKAAHTDWQPKVDSIRKLVDAGDQQEVGRYNAFLAAAMETGAAHQILYKLGDDPGEAKRLMSLSPVKQAAELAALAANLKAPTAPSGAPAPIQPIGSHGAHFAEITPDDKDRGMDLPKAEWFARREKQAQERGLQ